MDGLISLFILLVLTFIGVIILGLIAGFSPSLYIAQAALSTHKRTAKQYTYALMAGVTLATILLLVIFQSFSLNTLITTVDSAAHALFLSVGFNILFGLLFIGGGIYYVRSRHVHAVYTADTQTIKKAGGMSAFFGFGFAKTFLSVSGATAIFISSNLIASTSTDVVIRAIFMIAFLIASIVPFWVILLTIRKNPEKINTIVLKVKSHISQLNYRLTVGVAAILFGAAIIIFNCMMSLFY
jgi:cytochrome c biogenesis protein CcdA